MNEIEQHELNGIVRPGRGLGVGLMAEAAVMARLQEMAGFPIVPGTLNVRLPQPLERGTSWRYVPADDISPTWKSQTGQVGYFLVPVEIAGRYRGLAFQADEPGEPGYPSDQIELFAEVHLRGALGLEDGDPIAVSLVSRS